MCQGFFQHKFLVTNVVNILVSLVLLVTVGMGKIGFGNSIYFSGSGEKYE